MKIFHIRLKGSRHRPSGTTYCGAAPTDHDILHNWGACDVASYQYCRACFAKRAEAGKAYSVAKAQMETEGDHGQSESN